MLREHRRSGGGQMLEELPSVRQLNRLRRPLAAPLGRRPRPITTGDFDPRMGLQPSAEGLRKTIWAYLDRVVGFQSPQKGGVGLPVPERPIVHSQAPKRSASIGAFSVTLRENQPHTIVIAPSCVHQNSGRTLLNPMICGHLHPFLTPDHRAAGDDVSAPADVAGAGRGGVAVPGKPCPQACLPNPRMRAIWGGRGIDGRGAGRV